MRTSRAHPYLALMLQISWAAVGCSNTEGGGQGEHDGSNDAMTPGVDAGAHDAGEAAYAAACDMNVATADSGSCRSDRRLLECKLPGGGGMTCLSESCAEDPSFRPDRCEDLCEPDELAASCGGIGPNAGSNAPPNPACHDALATPGGVIFYCCPCAAK